MNIKMLIYILGKVLLIEGILMVLPIVCGVFYGEWSFLTYYVACAVAYVIAGYLISLKKPKNMTVFIKDGCVATALSWVDGRDPFIHGCNVRDGFGLLHDRCEHPDQC